MKKEFAAANKFQLFFSGKKIKKSQQQKNMAEESLIRFIKLSEENREEVVKMEVSKEQELFMVQPDEIIEEAESSNRELRIIQRVEDDVIVGMAMTKVKQDTLHLCRLMIDEKHQKKGYGTAALQAIIEETKAKTYMQYIMLLVDPKNLVAQNLYQKLDFKDVGRTEGGNYVYSLRFNQRSIKRRLRT